MEKKKKRKKWARREKVEPQYKFFKIDGQTVIELEGIFYRLVPVRLQTDAPAVVESKPVVRGHWDKPRNGLQKSRTRHLDGEKISILDEVELGEESIGVIAKKHGVNHASIYNWRKEMQRKGLWSPPGEEAPNGNVNPGNKLPVVEYRCQKEGCKTVFKTNLLPGKGARCINCKTPYDGPES